VRLRSLIAKPGRLRFGSTIGRTVRKTGPTLGGLAVALAALQFGAAVAQGLHPVESDDETIELAPLVVTATRPGESTFDLPVAIDVLDKANWPSPRVDHQCSGIHLRSAIVTWSS
jgi:hypothetical protein